VLAALAVDGLQADNVMASEAGDRTGEHGLDVFALANFQSPALGHAFVRRQAHIRKRFAYLLVRHQVQKRRLLQLYDESLLHGAVKNWFTGGVDEIRQQDGVLFRQRMLSGRPPIKGADNNQR
jgi:hypothetical protein